MRSLAPLLVRLTLIAGFGCSSSVEPGVRLVVQSTPARVPSDLTTDLGYSVTLERAILNVSRIEIVPCPNALRLPYDFLIPTAFAHTGSSPTVSGAPIVESLLDTVFGELATLHPPAAKYCSLFLTLAPADADAVGLAAEPDMLGYSLRASGTFTSAAGSPRAFTIASRLTLSFSAWFLVDLSDARASVTLRVDKSAAHWFDGVDFEMGDRAVNASRFTRNVRDSLSVVITD